MDESDGAEAATRGQQRVRRLHTWKLADPGGRQLYLGRKYFLQVHSLLFCHFDCLNDYLQMGMLVVEEEWEREVRGGGGIPVLKEV